MKKITITVVLLSLVVFTACTTVCHLKDAASSVITNSIASGLQCENRDAVRASVDSALEKIGVCNKTDKKQGMACVAVAGALINTLVPKIIPAEWQCRPDATIGALSAIVTSACSLLPF